MLKRHASNNTEFIFIVPLQSSQNYITAEGQLPPKLGEVHCEMQEKTCINLEVDFLQ